MRKDFSAGIVTYRNTKKETLYLLLHYPGGHWDLPKGHLEENENELEAAIRELEEETGITDIKVNSEFQTKIHYQFTFKKTDIDKTVTFFVGETKEEDINISHEHKGFVWLPLKEALEKITYSQARSAFKKAHAHQVFETLKKEYPNAKMALNWEKPHELLFAVVLSAQCTDIRVNEVTAKLFKKYPTLEDYAKADLEEIEKDIYSTGFYKNKAKALKFGAEKILKEFNGEIPNTMKEILTLPGVARKTANVVLGNLYNISDGFVVDTHIKRISQLTGLTIQTTPEKIEKDLIELSKPEDRVKLSYQIIDHGRSICKARKPDCENCPLNKICPSSKH